MPVCSHARCGRSRILGVESPGRNSQSTAVALLGHARTKVLPQRSGARLVKAGRRALSLTMAAAIKTGLKMTEAAAKPGHSSCRVRLLSACAITAQDTEQACAGRARSRSPSQAI